MTLVWNDDGMIFWFQTITNGLSVEVLQEVLHSIRRISYTRSKE